MRKLKVGLMAVAVLAIAAPLVIAAPAMAQQHGLADPLGLIASGAVIPFVGSGGAITPATDNALSIIEVYSPVGDESLFHMFFFDSSCTRKGDSIGLPVTGNGVGLLRVDNIQTTDGNPPEGLIAAADVDSTGFALKPLANPVHMRMLWFDVTKGFARTLEPISILNAETSASMETWNPLRTAATFFTPLVGPDTGLDTTIYFVCPNTAVTNDITNTASGAFPIDSGFPPLLDPSGHSPQVGVSSLRVRVYDTNEIFLRDLKTTCSCLTARPLALSPSQGGLSDVFHDASAAPLGTYTEVEGDVVTKAAVCDFTTFIGEVALDKAKPQPDCSKFVGVNANDQNVFDLFKVVSPSVLKQGPTVFTGYRGLRALGNGGLDLFGRLSNGNYLSIRGTLTPDQR